MLPQVNEENLDVHIALVGQPDYFEVCAPGVPLGWGKVTFVPFSAGWSEANLRLRLKELKPDIVTVFKPESLQSRCLEGLDAARIGWFTEPVPRADRSQTDFSSGVPARIAWSNETNRKRVQIDSFDLQRRLENAKRTIVSNFDRFITYDPHTVPALSQVADISGSIPLPISDLQYCAEQETFIKNFSRVSFVGRITPYRDRYISPILHEFDPLVVHHGLHGDDLNYILSKTGVGVNLHNSNYPNFENRAAIHLARGHLLISEGLSPGHGLEPGHDFVEILDPNGLETALREVVADPSRFRLIALRGRLKAEYFRASLILRGLTELVE